MDDYFENFDDDMNSGFDDEEFIDEVDEEPFSEDLIEEDEILFHEEKETDADGCFEIGWQDIALLGAMSEDIAEKKHKKKRIPHRKGKHDF